MRSPLSLLLPGDTRFATNFIMLKRLFDLKIFLVAMVNDVPFSPWLNAQKAEIRAKGISIRNTVNDASFWLKIETFLKLLGPIVNSLRLADSDIPAAGKIYMQMFNCLNELKEVTKDAYEGGILLKRDLVEVSIVFCCFVFALVA